MKAHQFLRVQEMIRKELGGDYAPQQLSILVLVSLREGITHTEIANVLNMPQGTVSRNVSKLALRRSRNGGNLVGYGLVENREDLVYDPRRKAVYLTEKGKELMDKIERAIQRADQ